jgi:hypothetical protein
MLILFFSYFSQVGPVALKGNFPIHRHGISFSICAIEISMEKEKLWE